MRINPQTLRIIRVASGLTQRKLAERVGCSHQLIAMIESGMRGMTDRIEPKIRNALSLTDDKLERIISVYSDFQSPK